MLCPIEKFKCIFWDFDGVIKESVNVKGQAFKSLFNECEDAVLANIYSHHLKNGGMSRYKKIPIYLKFANYSVDEVTIKKYLNKFSNIVVNKVINSNWVDGALEFIESNNFNQKFVLTSSTPQREIEQIVNELKIKRFFDCIYGSPREKSECINEYMSSNQISIKDALLIGDSYNDYEAAKNNNINFLFRKTTYNLENLKNFEKDKLFLFDNFNQFIYAN